MFLCLSFPIGVSKVFIFLNHSNHHPFQALTISNKMGSNGGEHIKIPGNNVAECSETTVEIKIKTLDSRTFTLRVDKCVIYHSLLTLDYSKLLTP